MLKLHIKNIYTISCFDVKIYFTFIFGRQYAIWLPSNIWKVDFVFLSFCINNIIVSTYNDKFTNYIGLCLLLNTAALQDAIA